MKKLKKPDVFKQVGAEHAKYQRYRREIISRANDALNRSKRAIFAMHRNDSKGAVQKIKEASRLLGECEKRFRTLPMLRHEGSYQAALEEYAEAILFQQFLKTGTFGRLEKRIMDHKIYLAALSDATGELVRHAVREATAGRFDAVKVAKDAVEEVIGFMMSLDLTGYLRQKFDQAKKNLSTLEQILYEIKMRE